MDQKFWNKLKIVKFGKTNKISFGQYAYKLKLRAHGASALKDKEYCDNLEKITTYLEKRQSYGSWSSSRFLTAEEMLSLHKIYAEMMEQDKITMRVEEPFATFYFETEDDAKYFATKMPKTMCIELFQYPESETELEALRANKIIKKRPIMGYAYCVTFKPGTYEESDKAAIKNLIENLDAKASNGFIDRLNDKNHKFWSSYKIYIRTEADYTWMAMAVNSKLLGKINQLHFTNK
mgnify:CR=1 FL=1